MPQFHRQLGRATSLCGVLIGSGERARTFGILFNSQRTTQLFFRWNSPKIA